MSTISDDLSPAKLRALLTRDGFVRIPSLLTPEALASLRAAGERSANLARNGKWPFVRTLPRQFPPWNSDTGKGIWGVQHLLHPDLPDHELFAASYFDFQIIRVVTDLLQCSSEDLVMELYNMLIRPDSDFALRWHRDDIPPDLAPEEEEKRLKEPALHAQWNLALYDDRSLIAVPGSHLRARTEVERTADPFEDNLPGQEIVEMKAGDIVFYNNNILHRGVYDSKVQRITLHGSMGIGGADPARARNVLQHGVGDWIDRCDFSTLKHDDGDVELGRLAEKMKAGLIAIGRGGSFGYSQPDE
ncbi:hypothetical protein AAFC00_007229 [Neodothiora populina]